MILARVSLSKHLVVRLALGESSWVSWSMDFILYARMGV